MVVLFGELVEEEVEAAGKVGNTEKIVASREVETSTGQLSSNFVF